MQQKVKDLIEKIKTERKYTFIALFVAIAMLFLFFSAEPPRSGAGKKAKKAKETPNEQVAALAQKEAYEDIITRFQSDLATLKEENKAAKSESTELKKSMKDYEERTAEIFKKILEKMADQQNQPKQVVAVQPQGDDSSSGSGTTALDDSLSNQELESFGLDQKSVAPPAPPAPQKIAFVGAGDSVRVKLLAGVNAPTDGTPYPVVFKLLSDIYGPDGSALPLGEARLIAAAQGSLTDQRALFRLTSLNIRLPNGQRKVLKADGWIVGEDGIRGMSGVLIDPIGKAIGGAGFAGFLAGVGEGIASANSTIRSDITNGSQTAFVNGDVGMFAAGRGASSAAREWSGIIRDRLSEMIPVVQVLSGREATAVFAKNLTITGLYEALEEGEDDLSSLN